MTAIPPSRYKVVERGRRLVVIDTLTGQPATREHVSPPVSRSDAPVTPPAARPVASARSGRGDDRSGNAAFTTSRLYDAKGPRRIVMDATTSNRLSQAMGGWSVGLVCFIIAAVIFPLLWAVPFLLAFQPKVRAALRSWITARLDEADQAGP